MFNRFVATLMLAGIASSAVAAETLRLEAGGYQTQNKTEVRIDGDGGAGSVIDLERLLGLERRSTVARLDGIWQINDRHALQFGGLSLGRNATRTLNQDITVGDDTFLAGTSVATDATSNMVMASWMPTLSANEFYSFSALLGIHFMDQKFEFTSDALAVEVRRKLGVPLPMLGLDYTTRPSEHWRVASRVQMFGLSYDNYDARASDIRLAVSWEPWKHGGLGMAYNMFRVRASADQNNYAGSFVLDRGGFELFAVAKF